MSKQMEHTNRGLEAPTAPRPPPITLRKETSDGIPVMPASLRSPLSPGPSEPPPPPRMSQSPAGPRTVSARSPSAGPRSRSPALMIREDPNEPRQIIIHAFAPRVVVIASEDTEDLARRKGIRGGFQELLQGFGDRIHGKVIIRDSIGGSKTYDDFGIRVNRYGGNVGRRSGDFAARIPRESRLSSLIHRDPSALDRLLQKALSQEASQDNIEQNGYVKSKEQLLKHRYEHNRSTTYQMYIRSLLSDLPVTPFETFAHPVACVIAVSSRNSDPTETLRYLYAQSSRGLQPWVSVEFLRYYVLVHDEEQDDITKTTALFESMKRHFGLHCHLLRLRSTPCVVTDDDSTQLPKSVWLSAREQLNEDRLIDDGNNEPDSYIFETDAGAIRTFLREMVTQSIMPFMENRMMTWNDQVAAKRKGLSGRFISLSKRWTGFGSMKGSKADSTSSSSNYDAASGAYLPESPEHIMRLLADYAFMLRDFKLAYTTYDLIRSDFAHDKAWAHHAAANEMSAVTYLILPQNARFRFEVVDALLETASYSYLTRCEMPGGALRALIMGIELLKVRQSDDAPRWGGRLLELGLLSPIGQTLITERIAECYRLQTSVGSKESCNRVRQAAFWSLLAAQSWTQIRQRGQVERNMKESLRLLDEFYDLPDNVVPFDNMLPFRTAIMVEYEEVTEPIEDGIRGISLSNINQGLDDGKEQLVVQPPTSHRRSVSGVEARKAATYSQPSVTILDQQRPADDGFE